MHKRIWNNDKNSISGSKVGNMENGLVSVTFMYSAKKMGLIQIKDIKKNNDYAILLKLCKKADCYLLKENLAEYRIRKKSISHDAKQIKESIC